MGNKPVETPVVQPPPPKPVEIKRESPALGIGLAIAGAAITGTAIYFGLDSKKQSDKLDGFTDAWTDREAAIEKRGQRSEKLAWAFGATGAVAIGVGMTLIITSGGSNERPRVTFAPTRGGATVGWSTGF